MCFLCFAISCLLLCEFCFCLFSFKMIDFLTKRVVVASNLSFFVSEVSVHLDQQSWNAFMLKTGLLCTPKLKKTSWHWSYFYHTCKLFCLIFLSLASSHTDTNWHLEISDRSFKFSISSCQWCNRWLCWQKGA